eukprot:3700450-Rhodomonas_salina.1
MAGSAGQMIADKSNAVCGLTYARMQALMDALDEDGGGSIDLEVRPPHNLWCFCAKSGLTLCVLQEFQSFWDQTALDRDYELVRKPLRVATTRECHLTVLGCGAAEGCAAQEASNAINADIHVGNAAVYERKENLLEGVPIGTPPEYLARKKKLAGSEQPPTGEEPPPDEGAGAAEEAGATGEAGATQDPTTLRRRSSGASASEGAAGVPRRRASVVSDEGAAGVPRRRSS